MEIAEKKESDNNTQSIVDSEDNDNNNNKDAEERLSRDLNTSLHPLKVSTHWLFCDVVFWFIF